MRTEREEESVHDEERGRGKRERLTFDSLTPPRRRTSASAGPRRAAGARPSCCPSARSSTRRTSCRSHLVRRRSPTTGPSCPASKGGSRGASGAARPGRPRRSRQGLGRRPTTRRRAEADEAKAGWRTGCCSQMPAAAATRGATSRSRSTPSPTRCRAAGGAPRARSSRTATPSRSAASAGTGWGGPPRRRTRRRGRTGSRARLVEGPHRAAPAAPCRGLRDRGSRRTRRARCWRRARAAPGARARSGTARCVAAPSRSCRYSRGSTGGDSQGDQESRRGTTGRHAARCRTSSRASASPTCTDGRAPSRPSASWRCATSRSRPPWRYGRACPSRPRLDVSRPRKTARVYQGVSDVHQEAVQKERSETHVVKVREGVNGQDEVPDRERDELQ